MPFIADRDLLIFEPSLFRDASWAGQTIVAAADASIAGTTLTSASSDFVAAGAAPGQVALVGGASLEVVEVLSATTLRVSRPRDGAHASAQAPLPVSGAPLRLSTFGPQIAMVHADVLRLLGVSPAGGPAPDEEDILNPRALGRLEALGALHVIFFGAAATQGDLSPLWARAAHYRERYLDERRQVFVHIDLDGDGVADAVRRPGLARFRRA
ncbi:MAG: hypothetical protein IBJ10_05490 [Phycisphaerales bacterium]|nr:hypothetical protein [Phycisphaerales bacterium]